MPHVRIQGYPDLHVNRGSTINLTCIISHTPEPPAYIFWYFNGEVMSYDSPRYFSARNHLHRALFINVEKIKV